MASNHNDKNIKYVGDSRIPAKRTPNIPKDYSEYPGKTEPFWPNFLLKEWMVGAVVLIGFLVLTVSHDPPLEIMADPTLDNYNPVPDWYFLFLFQLLKYTFASGPFVLLGAMVIPGLAFGALLLAPWLDRGPERRPFKRPIATGIMLLAVASIFVLTYDAYLDHDWEQNERFAWDNPLHDLTIATDHEAYEIYQQSCIGCHGGELEGTGAGPNLMMVGDEFDSDAIREIILYGVEGTAMPAYAGELTDEEIDLLVMWLSSLDGTHDGSPEHWENGE